MARGARQASDRFWEQRCGPWRSPRGTLDARSFKRAWRSEVEGDLGDLAAAEHADVRLQGRRDQLPIAADDPGEGGGFELDHPGGVRRQLCTFLRAETGAVLRVLPGANNI